MFFLGRSPANLCRQSSRAMAITPCSGRSGNLVFSTVSDTALDELFGLVRLLKEIGIPDRRE
jgi:hypothetical protein